MQIFFIIGIVLLIIYGLSICYVTVCEILEAKHPSEKAVTKAFSVIGFIYALFFAAWVLGHYVGGGVLC